jgi:eukaryotic-like serine/threonine-protein kinase
VNPSDSKRTCPDCGLDYFPKGKGHGCPHCLLRLAMPETENEVNAAESPPPAGLRSRFFAGYQILEEIARGGMGVIYKARQLSLNREVALKMIQAGHLLSVEARLRFRVEVEAVARLNHPNIVSLYESGEHEGIHYFTMRLVEGGNLSEYLRKHRSLRDNVALLIKVCRSVHYAHQRGILHRDLKPSNILIDLQEEPHVADFGLAKSLDYESGFTYSNSILGSPNYMAPEQASSHSGPVSTASDVYGLGAILYHILTGRPPFEGKTPLETIRRVMDSELVSPRRLNPQVDADLATICLKCLEKNPADRYESAEALARDLEHWLHGRPICARPIGTLGNLWRWSRRHPAVSTLSAALAVAMAGLMIGGPIALMRIHEAQRDAVSHLRVSLLDQARLLRLSKQMGVRSESIRLIRQAVALGGPPGFKDRARDELLATLAITDMEFSAQATAPTPDPELNLLDPQLECLASVVAQTNLVIRRLADGAELMRASVGTSTVTKVEAFSPDGRYLALRHVDHLSFWDTQEQTLCFATNGARRVFSFAAHAPQLFLEEWNYGVTVFELPSFRSVRRLQAEPDGPGVSNLGWMCLSVSPDGAMLACSRAQDNALELFDLKTGRIRWRQPTKSPVTTIIWQPLLRRLITASPDGLARFRRWDDGEANAYLRLTGPVRDLALDHSNALLASAGEDRVVRLWDLISYRQIFHSQCDAHQIRFDASGSHLGSVQRGDNVGWLDLSRSSEFQEMVVGGSSVDVERCEFSPDGRIVAAGYPGQIDLRRLRDGHCVYEIPVQRLPIFAFDPLGDGMVSSDSRGIAYRPTRERQSGLIEVSPPRMIMEGMRWRSLAFSGDGRLFFAANGSSNTVYVFDRTLTNCIGAFGPHEGVDALATTYEGRLVATGSSSRRDARVWDVASQSNILATSMSRQSRVTLSPNGTWLLIHGDGFKLLDLRTGKPAPPIQFPTGQPMTGAACFSHDSRVLAVVIDQYEVQLFDLATWKALGRLRGPRETRIVALAFSQDGSCISAAVSQGRLRVWNLARMRQQLAELNLDWDNPPFPAYRREADPSSQDVQIIDRH